MTDDTRERLIKLEAEFDHMVKAQEETSLLVKEMHALLMQAKGAKWAILGMATLGGFVSAKLSSLLPWFAGMPK